MFQKGYVPWNKGKPAWNKGLKGIYSAETLAKISQASKGRICSSTTRARMSATRRKTPTKYWLGKKRPEATRKKLGHAGPAHWAWIPDRTKLCSRRLEPKRIKDWSLQVKIRDGRQCKMANAECAGQLEAHHIRPWRHYPSLRFEISNGITLCHFHHPRKSKDEERLSPLFLQLIQKRVQLQP